MCWQSHPRPSRESPGNIRGLRARFCLLKTVRSFVPFLSFAEAVFSFEMEPFTVVLHEIGGVEIVPEGGLLFVGLELRYFQFARRFTHSSEFYRVLSQSTRAAGFYLKETLESDR